ncbi:molybdate ABC transporter substrate-binding protein [Alloyangia pacifica]|uniref:Molybdate transport system substrate-binding protein n=1 Tax=Alloyangia pacifica TaxID=311180 RepID=A0A1I6QU89_9RHOB|nr:molybdate ABC transporter substrate-binding protein [Alloyangia pacifica]SDF99483.1 molybdate transport system substrate-binding protein [Alloyangia pacifica]SFS56013.1 molybdate transport system substrate-binding protein [Alloyangia pacifica]
MKCALLPLIVALWPGVAAADPMLLAAASTGAALNEGIAESGISAIPSYGASGTLARQIEQGAPADLYISANPKWMAHLAGLGLVVPEDVSVLMSNSLVLIAPEGAAPLEPAALDARLAGESFAMADPQVAPVGGYGQAALESLGLWGAVANRLVPTRNTLATVAAVAQGEAALGLVYASDVVGVAGVQVVWQIPRDSHPPISYLIAPLTQGDDPEGAAALLDYLMSDAGQAVLARHGFLPMREGS